MSQTIYERWAVEQLSRYGFPSSMVHVETVGIDSGNVTFEGQFTRDNLLKVAQLVALKAEIDTSIFSKKIETCLDLGISIVVVKRAGLPVVELKGMHVDINDSLKESIFMLVDALNWKCEVLYESISLGVMQLMNQLNNWASFLNERRFRLSQYDVLIREKVQTELDVEAWDTERFLELIDGIFKKKLCIFVLEFSLVHRSNGNVLLKEILSDCINAPKLDGHVRKYNGELRRLVKRSVRKFKDTIYA